LLRSCGVLDFDFDAEVAESANQAFRDLVVVMVHEVLSAEVVKLDTVAK
jgi:hypothetical protein